MAKGEANTNLQDVDLSRISDEAFRALIQRMGNVEAMAAEKLKGPSYNLVELQILVDELKSEVCAILRAIKQLNAGKLPGVPLVEKWVKFQCA